MKINWTIFKVMFALVVVVGMIFWAVDSIRPLSYSGTDLNFSVGSGPVSVTNPSDQSLSVQMITSGSRSFRVSSTIEGVSGSSLREGTGTTRTQLFEFELPPGKSEFAISSGSDINFVADTSTKLQVTVNPMSDDSRRATIIATVVVVLGALFYASNATGHQWIRILRGRFSSTQSESVQDTRPTPVVADGGQGHAPRSYGDNRANVGD
jgi:hypothetical protein